jgi:phospholipid-binding lipoprotein MlaA
MARPGKVKAALIASVTRKIVGLTLLRLQNHKTQPNVKPGVLTLAVVAAIGLSSCGPAPGTSGISDPYEAQNRQVHKFNLALDTHVLRPVAKGATRVLPSEVEQGVVNFSSNLELPATVVNDVLQLRLDKAIENTLRFAINTTIGIGGLFDPATAAQVYGKPTDFGETLAVWGVGEGNYVELPFFGPSTDRDALGKVVDFAIDPLKLIFPNSGSVPLIAKVGAKIADRGRYSETVDSILYESADSYAQARLLYLQHRRFNLGEAPSDESFEDPYAQ